MKTSKSGTALSALAGIACLACCALALLLGTGLLSGGAATLLVAKLPIATPVLAALAVASFTLAAARRTGRKGCGDPRQAKDGCERPPART